MLLGEDFAAQGAQLRPWGFVGADDGLKLGFYLKPVIFQRGGGQLGLAGKEMVEAAFLYARLADRSWAASISVRLVVEGRRAIMVPKIHLTGWSSQPKPMLD